MIVNGTKEPMLGVLCFRQLEDRPARVTPADDAIRRSRDVSQLVPDLLGRAICELPANSALPERAGWRLSGSRLRVY
jgi:hypothetical protein